MTLNALLEESSSAPDGEDQHGDDNVNADEGPSLAELLDEEPDAGKPDGESQKKTPASKKFVDLSEGTGLKPDELYALEVAIDDKTSMSVGALKDLAKKATDYDAAQLELETKRQKQDADFTRMRGEFAELVRALPKSAVTTDAVKAASARYRERLEAAQKQAISAIEEWRDPETMKADRAGMSEFLKAWGFDAGYLDNVADPRTLKFVRDAWKLSGRVQAALSKLKRKGSTDRAPSGSNGKPPKKPASGDQRKESVSVKSQYKGLLDS